MTPSPCNIVMTPTYSSLSVDAMTLALPVLGPLYSDELDDVDLQVAVLENDTDEGVVGKTYTCLLRHLVITQSSLMLPPLLTAPPPPPPPSPSAGSILPSPSPPNPPPSLPFPP
ncbi:hypothetical protein E2C01_015807 [Portunus trituberculatus]|uniref:Uncharacterized protein n=1 Tax=Portunus trituberculatus TaxID=210409 RepID=A0A5B7DMH1_PORTR|nr:hypothetical protein [Portunus trituberculatus]